MRKSAVDEKGTLILYLLYIILFTALWSGIVLLKFVNQNGDDIGTPLYYSVIGIILIAIIFADILTIASFWGDVPINILGFQNVKWWDFAVGVLAGMVLLGFTAFTHALIIPMPFASSSSSVTQWIDSPLKQGLLTGLVAPIENGFMVSFPVATLGAFGGLLMMRFASKRRRRSRSRSGIVGYYVTGVIASLIAGWFAVQLHSFIYPAQIMQVTALSTYLFFTIGGIYSTFRRNTVSFDIAHFIYNTFTVVFALVPFTVAVFR